MASSFDLYLKVAREKAENIRLRLVKQGLFEKGKAVLREGGFIYLPVLKKVSIQGCVLTKRKSSLLRLKPRSLREALLGILSPSELELLPSAFDVIGDVAVLDLPDALLKKKKIVADALIKTFKNIKVVCVKVSPVSSEYRVRQIKVVSGEKRTVTVHKEYGCLYKLDVSTAYFSPRLGTERMRVAEQVKKGERVLVAFAGVGPYAILIAKKKMPKEVVAVELNPDAVRFMRDNARLNKVDVNVIEGDVKTALPLIGKFDRIVMPLPKDAGDFLDVALPALSKGGIIHFYDFAGTPKESASKVRSICRSLGYKIKVIDSVYCGSYSPKVSRICVDFKVLGK